MTVPGGMVVAHLWHGGTVSRRSFLPCFALLVLFATFRGISLYWSLLPTKENKTSKNPKDYTIIRAKIRSKEHEKYDKLSPNKYPHTYLLLILEQNKRKTNLRT